MEFDAFRNDWDPSDSHIALIKDSVRNHLAYVNTNITKDNLWHNVMLEITGNTIDVFVDNEKLLSWNGQFDNTYSGVGISGATGNANDWHLISIVKIQSGISN